MNTIIDDVTRTITGNNTGTILLDDTFDRWELGSYYDFRLETGKTKYNNGDDYNLGLQPEDIGARGITTIEWTCDESLAHDKVIITEASNETEKCAYNFKGLINCCDVPYSGTI